MIEMTIAAHDAAEIQVIADALQRLADLRRRDEAEIEALRTAAITARAEVAQTATVTVVDPAPAEAPKRRGRPPKAKPEGQADEAAVEAAEERAAIQAEAEMPVAEPQSDDDIPLEAPEPAPAPAPAAPALTLEAVRAKAASVSQAGKAAAVKALLTQMGAAKLTDLAPAKYPEFFKQLEAA